MRALGPADVLALWESGVRRHAVDRSALLCAWARPDLPPDAVADLPQGAVTAALLRLREASFGPEIECHVDCEHCGQRLEIRLGVRELLEGGRADADDRGAGDRGGDDAAEATCVLTTEVNGTTVRAPTLRDIAAVAGESDAAAAARRLLARCAGRPVESLDDGFLQAAGDAIEAADPLADIALALHCEACGREGSAQVDAGVLLWDEVESRARALLSEVHALAAAYGWTEDAILALSPARRAAYLALAGAE